MNKHLIVKMFLAVCMLIAMSSATVSAQSMITKNMLFAMQAGTVTLQHGKANVSLSKETIEELNDKENSPSYYVTFTPVTSDNISVTLSDKGETSFSVKANTKKGRLEGLKVDYVVFVSKTVSMPDIHAANQIKHIGISPQR